MKRGHFPDVENHGFAAFTFYGSSLLPTIDHSTILRICCYVALQQFCILRFTLFYLQKIRKTWKITEMTEDINDHQLASWIVGEDSDGSWSINIETYIRSFHSDILWGRRWYPRALVSTHKQDYAQVNTINNKPLQIVLHGKRAKLSISSPY